MNIHDPCVEGTYPSWLPHSEIPGANAQTTVHIDMKYHRNMAVLHQVNPLVHDTLWMERSGSICTKNVNLMNKSTGYGAAEWWETYALVCNAETGKTVQGVNKLGNAVPKSPLPTSAVANKKDVGSQQVKPLGELQRTCIAALVSYKSLEGNVCMHRNYIFNPRFLVFDKLCMIVSNCSYPMIIL